MIDIDAMRGVAATGGQLCTDGSAGVVVSIDWLRQVADELEAGRAARRANGRQARRDVGP